MKPMLPTIAPPSPVAIGIVRAERGTRASKIPKPKAANASCARNSAVTSTIEEAAATAGADHVGALTASLAEPG